MTEPPGDRYTHGHHASVVDQHRRRTAEDAAAFLLPHLEPTMSVLDVGCGPGSITIGLARRVPEGVTTFFASEARVSVKEREGELEDPAARPDLMAAIARATGGISASEPPPRPQDAPRRPVDALLATDREVDPLWSRSWLLLLLVLPLGAEWVLRRRLGLR